MFAQAIFAISLGAALTLTEPFIKRLRTHSENIRLMSRYGVGVLGTWPMFDKFLAYLGVDKETRVKANMAFLFSFIFVGIGVFLGKASKTISVAPHE